MPDPVEAVNETRATIESQPPSDGGNAPVAEAPPPSSDLDAIREELRKRNAETGN